jgi:hypothetical protein
MQKLTSLAIGGNFTSEFPLGYLTNADGLLPVRDLSARNELHITANMNMLWC